VLRQGHHAEEGTRTTHTLDNRNNLDFVNNHIRLYFSLPLPFLFPLTPGRDFRMDFSPNDLEIIQNYPINKRLRTFYDFLKEQKSQLDQPVRSNWISGLLRAPSQGKLRW